MELFLFASEVIPYACQVYMFSSLFSPVGTVAYRILVTNIFWKISIEILQGTGLWVQQIFDLFLKYFLQTKSFKKVFKYLFMGILQFSSIFYPFFTYSVHLKLSLVVAEQFSNTQEKSKIIF